MGNGTEDIYDEDRFLLAPEIFVFVMCPIGLLTNGIFLFLVARIKSMRTPFNIILSNIAVAGVLFLILVCSFTFVDKKEKPFERVFCFLFTICYVASSLFITIVATERLLSTFSRRKDIYNAKRRLAKICIGTWLLAVTCSGLVKLCLLLIKNTNGIALMCIILFFCLFFLVVNMVLYACVFWRLKKRPLASSSVQRRIMIKLVITTFAVFIFNTTHAIYIMVHYFSNQRSDTTTFEMIVLAVNAASSTINPLVYGFLSFDFKKFSARKVFCGCCSKEKRTKTYSSSMAVSHSVKQTIDIA